MEKRIKASIITVVPKLAQPAEEDDLFSRYQKEHPEVTREQFMSAYQQLKNNPSCEMCGGILVRMDAGGRGKAFADGNMWGCWIKTYRCTNCGYLK